MLVFAFLHILATFATAASFQGSKKAHSEEISELFQLWDKKPFESCTLYPTKKYERMYTNVLRSVEADVRSKENLSQGLGNLISPVTAFDIMTLFTELINFVVEYNNHCKYDENCRIRRRIKSAALLSPLVVDSTSHFVTNLKKYLEASKTLRLGYEGDEFVQSLNYFKYKYFCDLGSRKSRHRFFKENDIDSSLFSYHYQKILKLGGHKFSKQELGEIKELIDRMLTKS